MRATTEDASVEELKLPELGENIETVDVTAVLVKVGDRVEKEQPVVEVETEKASLEVPSTVSGTVKEILVKKGSKVGVGAVLLKIESGAAATTDAPPAAKPKEPEQGSEPEAEPEPQPKAAAAPAETDAKVASDPEPAGTGRPVTASAAEIGPTVPAAPSVRALARELGVDIHRVEGSGPAGRISRDDVKAHVKSILRHGEPGGRTQAPELPDFSQWGEISTEPLSGIRRATARNLANAWATVPHVTQFDRADVTQLESMRKRFNERSQAEGRKLTMTAIVIKMVATALKQFPRFNASLDLARDVVIHKKYVHVGVAVDTERGLLVPVIRDVDHKSLVHVATELDELAAKARDKKLAPDEMTGASFTVSNLGGLGTTYFTPIVNWPQVAILGVGRAETRAIWEEEKFEPRLILPLSISYDHRLIDGAGAARFLRWFAEALEQPLLLLLDD